MLQDNPFADLIPAQPQQVPGVIYGRPKQITPLEMRREARADEDQQLQREAAARSAMSADRAAAAVERQAANDERRLQRESVGDQSALRKEFDSNATVKRFNDIRAARQQIRTIALKPDATAQDDIALIFSYMRMLDPGSVVREGEFATAQNASGVPDQIINAYNRALSGERLNPAQRNNMALTAETLYGTERQAYNDVANRYQGLARDQGIDPLTVARRVIRDADNPAFQNTTPNTTEGGDIGRTVQALTISNVADLASGLSGGRYDINQDGTISYNGQPVEISDQVANSEDYRAAYIAKFGEAPPLQVSVTGGDGGASQPDGRNLAVSRGAGGFGETADAFVRGAADTVLLGGADELAGAVRSAMTGEDLGQAITRERNVNAYDNQNNFGARLTGQIAGGFVLPTGGARTAGELARVGGAYGAGYGFGSSVGDVGQRIPGTIAGGITGSATAAGLGLLGNSLANRMANRPPPGSGGGLDPDVVAAAQRQRVDIVRPDADPSKRSAYGFLESLPFSGGRIRNDLQRGANQMEQRVSDIGGGQAAPRQTVGESVRTAGERYVDRSRTVVSRLYDRAATLAGDAQVSPAQALSTIDSHIASLSQTPSSNRTKLELLNQFRSDLVDEAGNLRPLSIQAIRDLRSNMRDELATKGLRFSDTERRVMDAIDSASKDISSQLQGPALRAFQRADKAYRERADIVDNVVERFIGADRTSPRSGEGVVAAVERAAAPRAGDANSLNRFMQRLEPQEKSEVQSLIAAQLGRKGGDTSAPFSASTFATQLRSYSKESLEAIFGRKGAEDLADIATLATAREGTMSRLNNSRSGQVSNWFDTLRAALTGGGLGGVVGAASGIGAGSLGAAGMAATPAVIGGAYISARSLGSPRFVSALAQASKARTHQQQQQVLRYMATIASREPAIANDILPLQQALQSSVSRAAAGENEQNRR